MDTSSHDAKAILRRGSFEGRAGDLPSDVTNDTLVVTGHEVRRMVDLVGLDRFMDEMIARVRTELTKSRITVPPRAGFELTGGTRGLLEWMPCLGDDLVVLKLVSYQPTNPTRVGLPTILGTLAAFDPGTGHLLALIDAVLLTAIRTGAASALASQVLAPPDAHVLGLIGCGAQAVTQAHALSRVFDLHTILCFDTDSNVAASFAARLPNIDVDVRVVALADLERGADIICTATSVDPGVSAVMSGTDLRENVHINAIGSDVPGKTELPIELLRQALVCPDFVPQALVEGESQRLSASELGPDLAELLRLPAHSLAGGLTVFDSTGFAAEDYAAVRTVLELAAVFEVGERRAIEWHPIDPKAPYAVEPRRAARSDSMPSILE